MLLSLTDEERVIAPNDKESRLAVRADIESYADNLKAYAGSERGEMDEINEKGLSEYIIGGAYTRILDVPAGVTIVSELWKSERLWIIISGEVLIKTEQGDKHIVAPYIAEAPYGSKVALYAITDTKWAAITGVKTEELEEIKEEVIAKDYSEFVYDWELLEDKK